MQDDTQEEEAHYWFVLMDFKRLIDQYGWKQVLFDFDTLRKPEDDS